LLRFLVIGVSCVFVDLAVYRLLGWKLNLRLDVAKGVSYWAGVVVGFVGNKFWTFRSTQKSLREPLAYVILYVCTMLANIACNGAVLSILGANATALAFLFATGVTTCLNFAGMRLLVFRHGIQERNEEKLESVSTVPLEFNKPPRRRAA
jgi:putative flippase GtrA